MNGLKVKSISELKVAIPIIGDEKWMGGITYIHYLVNALSLLSSDNKPKVYLVFRDRQVEALKLHEYMFNLFDGLIYIGNSDLSLEYDYISCSSYDELAKITDVFFPVITDSLGNRVSISWIPDFQHKHLPHMFSNEEITVRDNKCEKVSQSKGIVLFSSKDALKDYEKFYPNHNTLTKVMPFYLIPPEEWYEEKNDVFKIYGIHSNYFICSNQLWKHKNHLTLFKAIKYLKEQGTSIKVVLTGAKEDYRFPEYYNELMNFIEENGLQENIKVLGFIPRDHQIYLVRKSIAVIQPSLFEGWGTFLEDSRALGKTIILSQTSIHQEQKTDFSIFFVAEDEFDLAEKIKNVFENQVCHNSNNREESAKQKSKIYAQKYAENFADIIYSTYLFYRNKEDAK